ncbi:hypothetical protein BLOT_001780 [Blomia tropicalis]|nr:hypothetical protein BLOT_001780 [Blomia tropicalis]
MENGNKVIKLEEEVKELKNEYSIFKKAINQAVSRGLSNIIMVGRYDIPVAATTILESLIIGYNVRLQGPEVTR